MSHYQPSQTAYPNISVSDNARAIIGNVYHTCEHDDDESPDSTDAPVPRLKSSRFILKEEYRPAEHFGRVVVTILEDFKSTKKAFQQLRYLHRKTQRCASHISIREAVFEQSLLNFIALFTRRFEDAHAMLLDAVHATWTDITFLEYLQDRCSTATEALWETLNLIVLDLEHLDSFVQSCEGLGGGNRTESTQRLLFSAPSVHVSERDLLQLMRNVKVEARLDSLKENTASFEKLIQQRLPLQIEPSPHTPTSQTKMKLGRYSRTQEAAGSLYRSLGLACLQHPIHQAQIRLRTESGDPSQVQFSMMLRHAEGLSNIGNTCSVGLTIESQVIGTVPDSTMCEAARAVASKDAYSKRKLDQAEQNEDVGTSLGLEQENQLLPKTDWNTTAVTTNQKRIRARVDRRHGVHFTGPTDIMSLPLKVLDEDWPNFCHQSNFCTHVQRVLAKGFTAGHPLGYLHTREHAKHLIYLSSQTCLVSTKSPVPLMESLNTLCTNRKLSTAAIVSLSKQLSIAVLQYNATPWIEQWDADHVMISSSGVSQASFETDIFDSYLDVSIGNLPQHVSAGELHETFVPNMTLFRLGIMLLELAYQKPLHKMQEPSDQRPNQYDTAFATARRLRRRVSEKMGPKFADIIGKCIQCDFGQGQDLKSKLLQECYYENVVQRLEDLEIRFRRLSIPTLIESAYA